MLRNYPDSSELTFVVSTERGKSFVQNYAHREVGGILPAFKSYDEYKAETLSGKLALKKMERGEELVYLLCSSWSTVRSMEKMLPLWHSICSPRSGTPVRFSRKRGDEKPQRHPAGAS